MKIKWLFIILFFTYLISCNDTSQLDENNNDYSGIGNTYIYPRVSVDGVSGGLIQFAVQLEGINGNAVTGAYVVVTDQVNRSQILRFNSENYCYTGFMQDIQSIDLYTVTIISNYLLQNIVINVPYQRFQNKPAITVLKDENGTSALSGYGIDGSKSIQAAWSSCGDDTVYQVIVRTSMQNIFTLTTEDLTAAIPKNTLEKGTYIISIKAQKISGDPLFKNNNFYSVATANSLDVTFAVN